MGIQGNLQSVGVLELFSMLNQWRKTGILSIITETAERGFLFCEGNLICATASDAKRRIGSFLVRLGFISEDEINMFTVGSQYVPGHFGQQLLETGKITSKQLRTAVKAQIFSILNEVLGWESASFFFDDSVTVQTPKRGLVATPSFILEVAKRTDDHRYARKMFPEPNLVFAKEKNADASQVEEELKGIFSLVTGKNSIDQILFLSSQAPKKTANQLKELWDRKLIRRAGIRVTNPDKYIVPNINYTAVDPQTPVSIFKILNKTNKKLTELTNVIAQEPLFVAKILKLLTLSNIQLSQKDLTIKTLIHLLGTFQTWCLLLPESMRNLFYPRPDLYWRDCWEHDKMCALLSKKIAEKINYPFPDEAYLAALLHNLGVYILLTNNATDYRWLITESFARKQDIVELEEKYYSIPHTRIGMIYAKKWNFPQQIRLAISEHHAIEAGITKALIHIVFVSQAFTEKNGYQIGYKVIDEIRLKQSMEHLGVNEAVLNSLFSEIQHHVLTTA